MHGSVGLQGFLIYMRHFTYISTFCAGEHMNKRLRAICIAGIFGLFTLGLVYDALAEGEHDITSVLVARADIESQNNFNIAAPHAIGRDGQSDESGHNWDISNDFGGAISQDNVTYNTSARYYTGVDVQSHNSQDDCWVSVNNAVYDVTGFDPKLICGSDQTALYSSERGRSVSALNQYFIGYLDTDVQDNNDSDASGPNITSGTSLSAPPINTAVLGNDLKFTYQDFNGPHKDLWQSIWAWFKLT